MRERRKNSGSALIVALFVMVILVSVAATTSALVRLHLRASRAEVSSLQRLYAAQAGLRLAEAVLRADEDATADSLMEDWASLGDSGNEARAIGDASFRVQIIDACSRVNLNSAPKEMLQRLPGIDDSLSDAILDWREEGDTPRPSGAKADYYQGLPEPYLPRGAAFETVAELLLVRGVTAALLYGPPQEASEGDAVTTDLPLSELLTPFSEERNVTSEGEARVNLNTATEAELQMAANNTLTGAQAAAIVQYRESHGQFTSIGELLDVPGMDTQTVRDLADKATTTADTTLPGRINVNTASAQVLATVPGITADIADAIVSARDGDNGAFTSIGELLDSNYLDAEAFRQAAPYLCTRSAAFLVRVMSRVPESPTITAIEALVERTEDSTRVLRWSQVERAPGWIAWGWTRTWPEVMESDGESNSQPGSRN